MEAAPTAPAGYDTYNAKSFRIIGTMAGLTGGLNDITALYVAKYGTPLPGSEIALRLVPMDATGEQTGEGEQPSLRRAA